MEDKSFRLQVFVPKDLVRASRVLAAQTDKTLPTVVADALRDHLQKQGVPVDPVKAQHCLTHK